MSLSLLFTHLPRMSPKATVQTVIASVNNLIRPPPPGPAESISTLHALARAHPTWVLRNIYWIRQHSPITLFHEYIVLQVSEAHSGRGEKDGTTHWIRIDRRAGGAFRLSLLWTPSESTKNEVRISRISLFDMYDCMTSRIMGRHQFVLKDGAEGEVIGMETVACVIERMMSMQKEYRIWSSNCWTWSRAIFDGYFEVLGRALNHVWLGGSCFSARLPGGSNGFDDDGECWISRRRFDPSNDDRKESGRVESLGGGYGEIPWGVEEGGVEARNNDKCEDQ